MPLQGTRLEVNLAALEHNFHYLKSKLQSGVKFMAVVKANAYGHGAVAIAHRLQELDVDYFAVAYVSEAVELRDNGIKKPILVLHAQAFTLNTCIERCIEPVIYSIEMLDAFIAIAQDKQQSAYPIHLEFNTGLNRIGIDFKDIDEVISKVTSNSSIKVRGLQSHLAASEDLNELDFTNSQIELFKEINARLEKALPYPFLKHESNTSGILNYKDAHFSMVRSGIGLYGFGNDHTFDKQLKPVASLKSVISQTRWIEAGESVSYNRKFIAQKRTQYAVIALGHGDGINRIYGYGKAQVSINGKLAPTLGIICMDMFMVDITNIDCYVGDEVIIFNQEFTAREMAEKAGTISYEILTGIQKRVPRIYFN
ncbi:alanine racemase [Nonlabens mediterrranea]|uniref:Alanine racemase n=1 Tax=Nonlabens mediterrranea TaxID=1419947 RepID=A0ABS0A1B7_9FLAO|nr:alanine racemase [Nonlabens mediterrranea]